MKLKKWLGMLLSLMMIAAVGVGISACGTHVVTTEYVTVTWYDGTTAIKTNDKHVKGVTISEKEFPSEEELHKEGYTFENWYKDLQCTAEFDFAQKITANTNIYGKWTKGEEPPVDTHTHSYGNWTVTLKPTLEQEGRAERTCTAADCDNSANKTEGKVLPKLSEAESYTIDHTKPAKCNEKGLDTYTLKAETSISFTVDVDMAEHNYGALIAEQPATCTSEGTHAHYHCDVCNQDFLQVEGKPASTPANPEQLKIEKLDHKMHEHAADPADCQKAGTLKYYTCEYEEGVYYADEEGTETLEDITDPKKDHTYEGAEWHHDENGHWQVCTMCQTQESEHQEHDTKGKDGVEGACSVCGYVKETVEHTHTYGDWQITKPTTEREGSAERTCNDPQCDHSEGETETKVLPKLSEADKYTIDHTEEPDCEKTGTDKYTLNEDTSIFFDVEVPATGHTYGDPTWEWVEDEGGDGYASATATFTCKKNDKTETVTVEKAQIKVEDKTNQCTTDKIYTATVHFGEKDYTDTKTKNIQGSHNLELVPVKEATCTQTGTKAHYECQTCHKLFDEHDQTKEVHEEDLVIQAKGHQFSPWKVELKPEENSVGRATRECTKCEDEAGRTEEIELPELSKADKYDIVHTQEPGCTEDGTYTYTLKGVEEISFEVTIEKLGHEMTKHDAKDATCTKDGNELYYTCNHEGDDKIYKDDEGAETWENLEATVRHATGHSYGEWEITPPTKDGKGSATKTCQNCGTEEPDHTITVELPALDSDEATAYVKGVDTATCTDAGTQEYTYTDPAHPEYGEIKFTVKTEAKGHDFNGTKWEHDDEKHWQKCAVCDTAQEEAGHQPHTFDNGHCATCDAYEKYTLTFDLGDAEGTLTPVENKEVYANEPKVNLPGAPERANYNFKGWLCEADNKTYTQNQEYTATKSTKFTAQWEPVSANECPYNFYITGNGAGDLSRSGSYGSLEDDFRMAKTMSGNNTVYTYELRLYKGDNFKIASDADKDDKWKVSANYSNLNGGNARSEFEQNETDNIGAKAYGKYKVTLTVNKAGTCQSLTIDKLETYTGTSQFKGWYVTGTIVDPQWKQAPTEYELTLSSGNYIGFFKFDEGAAFKVIKVNATIVNGDEVGYTAEWHSPNSGANGEGNYEVKATGWYKVQIANSTSTSTKFYVYPATEHTHNYTWNVTLEPTEGSTGTVTGTCQNKSTGSTQVPCDKPEVTLTLPELKEENGYTVTGNHSCTAQYTLHYKVTLQDEDKNSYEVEFDLTHEPDAHVTDGTWQSDAVHHWHKCENCETHVDEAEHEFVGHVCSECEYHAKKVTAHFALGYETETVGDEVEYADDKSETITLPTPEDRVGYEFNGWLLDGKGEPEKETHAITFGETDTELNFTAKWTAIVYTVKFASTVEGATLPETPATTSLEANTTFTLTALTLKGYEFLGWFVNDTKLDQQEADYLFELTAEKIGTEGFVGEGETITITAQWKANEYTVVFAHDPATVDGENVTNMPTVNGKITVEDGKNTITLTKPVREGYTFVNWVRGNGDTVEVTGETATYTLTAEKLPSGDTITFTAKWTENDYHVTYDLKGGTVTSGTIEDTKVYHVRGTVTISNVEPTRTGYTFDGWKVKGGDDTVYKKDGAHTTYTMKAEDVTFEAQWTAKKYTIRFDVNKPVDASEEIEAPEDQNNVTLEAESNTITLKTLENLSTYDFDGWTLVKNTGKVMKESTTLTEEMINNEAEGVITLYASWTKHGEVTATFSYGTWTEGAPAAPTSKTGTAGTTFQMPEAADRTGYTFKGWKEDNKEEEPIQPNTEVQLSATSYTAQWEAIKYKIVLGDKETLTDVTLENAQAFAAPEARKGYRFDGWKFNGVKYEKLTAKLIEAAKSADEAHTITLEAAWTAIDYTIKLQVTQPQEGVEVEPVEPEQVTGALAGDHTKFTLPAPTAPTGYKFDGWKLSESKTLEAGENTFSEDMIPEKGEEITLTTTWSLIEYKIVFTGATHDPITGVTLDTADGHTFPTKDTITKTGYEFAGWKLEGHVGAEDAAYTKLTTELIEKAKPADPENAITLVAQWTSVKYTVVYSAGVEEEIEVPTDGNTYALDGETEITVSETKPEREGYKFDVWTIGESQYGAGETINLEDVIEHADGKNVITLTAKWTKLTKVTFICKEVQSVKYYDTETTPTIPAEDFPTEGRDTETEKFLGWFDGDDTLYTHETQLNGDVILTAKFAKYVSVTWFVDGDQQHQVTAEDKEYWVGKQVDEAAYTPEGKEGHTLDGWYTQDDFQGKYSFEEGLTADLMLYARYIKTKITVTYVDENGVTLKTAQASITGTDGNVTKYATADQSRYGKIYPNTTLEVWEVKANAWHLESATGTLYAGEALFEDTTLHGTLTEITSGRGVSSSASTHARGIFVGGNTAPTGKYYSSIAYSATIATYSTGTDWNNNGNLGYKRDTSLKSNEIYTVRVRLAAGDNFRIVKKGTWTTIAQKAHLAVKNTAYFTDQTGDSDGNLHVVKAGVYDFVFYFNKSGTPTIYYNYVSAITSSNLSYYLKFTAGEQKDTLIKLTSGKDQEVTIAEGDTSAAAKVVYAYYGDEMYDEYTATSATAKSFGGAGKYSVKFTQTSSTAYTGTLTFTKYNTFSVTYDLADGQGTKPDDVTVEAAGTTYSYKITAEDPTKDGYRFLGWKLNDVEDDLYQKESSVTLHTGNNTLTAVFKQEFTVTYEKGNYPAEATHEWDVVESEKVLTGEKVSLPTLPDPEIEGETYSSKWTINGVEHAAGEQVEVTENMTVIAEYEKLENAEPVTVNWHIEGDQADYKTEPMSGTQITALETYTKKDGYTLDGWYTKEDFSADSKVSAFPTAEKGESYNFYARWYKTTVTVKFVIETKYSTSTSAQTTETQEVKSDTNVAGLTGTTTVPTQPTKKYMTFAGWVAKVGTTIVGGDTKFNSTTKFLDDTTFYATWTETTNTSYKKDTNYYYIYGHKSANTKSSMNQIKDWTATDTTLTFKRDETYSQHNVYVLDLTLYYGDSFQILHSSTTGSAGGQMGYAYLDNTAKAFMTTEETGWQANIIVAPKKDGEFHFTLSTDPNKMNDTTQFTPKSGATLEYTETKSLYVKDTNDEKFYIAGDGTKFGSWGKSSYLLYKDTSLGKFVYTVYVKFTKGDTFKVTDGSTWLGRGSDLWDATSETANAWWADTWPDGGNIVYNGSGAWYRIEMCYKVRGGTSGNDHTDFNVAGSKTYLRIYKV